MKSLLFTVALSTSIFAGNWGAGDKSAVCKMGIDNSIKETVLASSLLYGSLDLATLTQKYGTLEGYQRICKFRFENILGLNINISTNNQSGLSNSYNVALYCTNWGKYLAHIQKKYEQTGDINILRNFVVFVSRPLKENMNAYKSLAENRKDYQALALLDTLGWTQYEKEDIFTYGFGSKQITSNRLIGHFESYLIAYQIFEYGLQTDDRKIGYKDMEFQDFLSKVISGSFKQADKILSRQKGSKVVAAANDFCDYL